MGHAPHTPASESENQPPGQSVQMDWLTTEYLDASQVQHSPMPGDGENLPSGQEVQVGEPAKENSPAAHNVSHVAAPALLAFPLPHSKQTLRPTVSWYLPASHSKHSVAPSVFARLIQPAGHEGQ
jgi:hypothetical protein